MTYLPVLFAIGTTLVQLAVSHHESGEWSCSSESVLRLTADYRPGLVTLDGKSTDWKSIGGLDFPLLPAIDPDLDKEFSGGKMNVKALHDGTDVFFMLQVTGNYTYAKGNSNKCPSAALMFQIGDNATYHNMGGCNQAADTCNSSTCKGHEVDIMHFSLGNAIPGRLYGENAADNQETHGGDRFGHLVDLYAWNPHCRFLDKKSPSGNDSSAKNNWRGAWWHSSLDGHSDFIEEDYPFASNGLKGSYYFEFSRPLRTMDHLQQDVQFTIGESSNMSVAFWYPSEGKAWRPWEHYSIHCDWIMLDIVGGNPLHMAPEPGNSVGVVSSIALILSIFSLCLSIFVWYRLLRPKTVPFSPLEISL